MFIKDRILKYVAERGTSKLPPYIQSLLERDYWTIDLIRHFEYEFDYEERLQAEMKRERGSLYRGCCHCGLPNDRWYSKYCSDECSANARKIKKRIYCKRYYRKKVEKSRNNGTK